MNLEGSGLKLMLACIYILMMLTSITSSGFAQSDSAPLQYSGTECPSKLFDEAERAYRQRAFRNNSTIAMRKLEFISKTCTNAHVLPEIDNWLAVLSEESAERSFQIANYYINRFKAEGRGLKGAQARLLLIVDKVPNYSRIDETIFLLGETYLLLEDPVGARRYFTLLLDEFPNSAYSQSAGEKLENLPF